MDPLIGFKNLKRIKCWKPKPFHVYGASYILQFHLQKNLKHKKGQPKFNDPKHTNNKNQNYAITLFIFATFSAS